MGIRRIRDTEGQPIDDLRPGDDGAKAVDALYKFGRRAFQAANQRNAITRRRRYRGRNQSRRRGIANMPTIGTRRACRRWRRRMNPNRNLRSTRSPITLTSRCPIGRDRERTPTSTAADPAIAIANRRHTNGR
jgi:hypothetical protein